MRSQNSEIGRDCDVAVKRLKALSLSVSQPVAINTTPSVIRRNFFPAHVKRVQKDRSMVPVSKSPAHVANFVRHPPVQTMAKAYSFLPVDFTDYGPHRILRGFHIGKFTAYCPLSQTFDSYVCNDHGQYPWGHSHRRGAMALLCQKLRIKYGSNVRNTCLPLHVLIGMIDNDIINIDELAGKHRAFIHGLLSSRTMRDGYPTIKKMFRVLQLEKKVCLRIIDRIEHDTFTVLDRYFGDLRRKTIFIAHVPWHFFLAKRLDW